MKIFSYKINGTAYKVAVQSADHEVVELEVNGTPYVVELDQKKKKTVSRINRQVAPAAAAAPVASTPKAAPKAAPAGGGTVVSSPLPGSILEVKVSVGDTVKRGDTVMVLEAMKMENNIQATADGTITKIVAEKGATVLEGDQLLIIG